jgi:hypothetical protein
MYVSCAETMACQSGHTAGQSTMLARRISIVTIAAYIADLAGKTPGRS